MEEVVSMPTYDKGDGHRKVPDDVDLKSAAPSMGQLPSGAAKGCG
ncbi:MAG: hypothetical protein ACLRUN_14175 [Christensenellales bacterium]